MPNARLIRRALVAALAGGVMQTANGVASGGASTLPAPAVLVPSTSPGPEPGIQAPITTWQNWEIAQRQSMETTTWSTQVEQEGMRLLSVEYVTAGPSSGAPPGVTTTAAVVSYESASPVWTARSSPSTPIPPPAGGGRCTAITDGSACVRSANGTGGYTVNASYTYQAAGTIRGHVEMTKGGCPGSLVKNGSNQTFTSGVYQTVVYGPVAGSAKWATTFWLYSGGNYTNWGTVCATL